jgi:hypothetical protein
MAASKHILYALILAALASGSLACSRGSNSSSPQVSDQEIKEGPLTASAREMFDSPHTDQCSAQDNPKRLEIAQALDARASEIKSSAAADSAEIYPDSEVVNITPAFFIKFKSTDAPVDQWIDYLDPSWDDLYQYYLKIKNSSSG